MNEKLQNKFRKKRIENVSSEVTMKHLSTTLKKKNRVKVEIEKKAE